MLFLDIKLVKFILMDCICDIQTVFGVCKSSGINI